MAVRARHPFNLTAGALQEKTHLQRVGRDDRVVVR
jgi:hypothetical protein